MTSLVVVAAGLSNPSSTRLLADMLTTATVEAAGVDVRVIEVRDLAQQLTEHLLTGFPGPELSAALDAVRRADGVIAVTPVFAASYSGLFKTFFDVMEEEGLLDGKPVLLAAAAGTARHSLVLEHALRPLFSYLHAVVVPTGVFAATDDFGDAGLDQRIARAAHDLVSLMHVDDAAPRISSARRLVEDEFADPTPFAELLRQASAA